MGLSWPALASAVFSADPSASRLPAVSFSTVTKLSASVASTSVGLCHPVDVTLNALTPALFTFSFSSWQVLAWVVMSLVGEVLIDVVSDVDAYHQSVCGKGLPRQHRGVVCRRGIAVLQQADIGRGEASPS